MTSRLRLHAELEALLKCNVYYDPPESIKLSYPCVIYSKARMDTLRAGNSIYQMHPMYQVKCLSKDPDNEMADLIMRNFRYASFENRYTHDHIHHDVLNLYYWKDYKPAYARNYILLENGMHLLSEVGNKIIQET